MGLLLNKISSAATLFFSLFVLFYTARGLIKLQKGENIPALFVFGDSILDTGNNNEKKTIAKANFAPYGRDFNGGQPTGRFCNGKVPSDIIATELGLKDTLPAYLDPELEPVDLVTGVSFASGGSGYDPLTATLVSTIPLTQQLQLFKEYIGKLKETVGEEESKDIVAKSLYIINMGSNDFLETYFLFRARKLQFGIASYSDFLVGKCAAFLKDLYSLGARRVGVFNIPAIGCMPSQRTLKGGEVRDCAEELNKAAEVFNSKLKPELDSLNDKLPDGKIVYTDIYTISNDIVRSYKKYGFEVDDVGCCAVGALETVILCDPLSPATCAKSSTYVFWDSYHPTETTYKILVDDILPKLLQKLF